MNAPRPVTPSAWFVPEHVAAVTPGPEPGTCRVQLIGGQTIPLVASVVEVVDALWPQPTGTADSTKAARAARLEQIAAARAERRAAELKHVPQQRTDPDGAP